MTGTRGSPITSSSGDHPMPLPAGPATARWLPAPMRRRRDAAAASVARDRDDLLRLLAQGGCPVCRYRNAGVGYWFRAYAAETHTEPDVQQRMAASLGPCAAHTRYLIADESAPWLLKSMFADIVRAGLARLDGRDTSPVAVCRLCAQERKDEESAVALIARALDDTVSGAVGPALTTVQDAYRESGGACLVHALDAVRSAGPRAGPFLADVLRHRLDSVGGPDGGVDLVGSDPDVPRRAALRRGWIGPDEIADPSVRALVGADLAARSCPVCRAGHRAEARFLRWAATTGADGGPRGEEVTLCQRHLADVATDGPDARGVVSANAVLWQGRLGRYASSVTGLPAGAWVGRIGRAMTVVTHPNAAQRWPQAGRELRSPDRVHRATADRLRQPPSCRACHAVATAEQRAAALLDAVAIDPAFDQLIGRVHGACLRHVLAGIPAAPRYREVLRARLALLAWSLEESLRKDGWTTRWEVRGREMAAWTTAPTWIDGHVYAGWPSTQARSLLDRPGG